MAKYLVETFYTCTFKVSHYLDKIDEKELSDNLSNLGQMGEEFHTPTDKFNEENEVVLETDDGEEFTFVLDEKPN